MRHQKHNIQYKIVESE